jgi:hypothetical protein
LDLNDKPAGCGFMVAKQSFCECTITLNYLAFGEALYQIKDRVTIARAPTSPSTDIREGELPR